MLTGYEWFRRDQGDAPPFDMPQMSPPATRDTLFAFFDFLEAISTGPLFLAGEKAADDVRNMRNLVHRLQPSEQDIRTLRGAIDWLVKRGKPAPKARRGRAGRRTRKCEREFRLRWSAGLFWPYFKHAMACFRSRHDFSPKLCSRSLAAPFLLNAAARAQAVADLDLAIIGAARPEIVAAHRARAKGLKAKVFEAQGRLGGRVYTDETLGAGFEAGAFYIHFGERNPARHCRTAQVRVGG